MGARLLATLILLALFLLSAALTARGFGAPPSLPRAAGTRAAVLSSTSWPMANGDVGSSRRSLAAPALGGGVAWSRALPGAVATASVADAERVYVALADGRVLALRARDGTEQWTYDLGVRPWGAPTVAGDGVYLALRSGDVLALDAGTGALRWRVATRGSFFTAPAVADGIVYVHDQGDLIGLDAESGHELWSARTGARQSGSAPVLDGSRLALATSDRVVILDRATGARTYEYASAQVVQLALDGRQLLTVSARFVTAADPATEAFWWEGMRGLWTQAWLWGFAPPPPPPPVLWYSGQRPTDVSPRVAAVGLLPPAVGPDYLVVAHTDGLVRAFARGDGRMAWEHRFAAVTGAPTAVAGGFVIPIGNAVVVLYAADGSERERREFADAELRDVLLLGHGTYVIDRSGTITALR